MRITDMPIVDRLREIRQLHLNTLVRTEGVVTRRTSVFPQLKKVAFQCSNCQVRTGSHQISLTLTEHTHHSCTIRQLHLNALMRTEAAQATSRSSSAARSQGA